MAYFVAITTSNLLGQFPVGGDWNIRTSVLNVVTDGPFEAECAASPFVYVDVGARGGIDRRWKGFKKYFLCVAFEADEVAYKELLSVSKSDPALKPIFAALHNKPGETTFHVTRKPAVSSLLAPNREFLERFPDPERFDVLKTVRLEATTLDSALQANGIGEIDFVKVDTQGSALWVLEGGTQALSSAFGVEVETEFAPLYQGQPLFNEVDRFMRAKGFELFDINRSCWKRHGGGKSGGQRGQLVFGDALYLRPPEEFVERVTDHPKARIIKATLVCLAYGYLDLAVAIWDQALSRSIVCHDDYRMAIGYFERENRVTTSIAKLIPARLKVARACQLLREVALRGVLYGSDGWLGNTSK